jgi:hypothetical protein
MNESLLSSAGARRIATSLIVASAAIGMSTFAACSSSSSSSTSSAGAPSPQTSVAPGDPAELSLPSRAPSPDPRVGLKAGVFDAGVASWNMRLVSTTPPSERFAGVTNSDLAFSGNLVYQGNYNGYQVWDISTPTRPSLVNAYLCPASQSDVSIYKHLLFVSAEAPTARLDCGTQGVADTVSTVRIRGVRIIDVSNPRSPQYVANVQTCRGSHTHTVVSDPRDPANVYIYISGSSSVRSPNELPGCLDGSMQDNPNTARFRIEVIQVPLARPQDARIVTSPRIFTGLTAPPPSAANASDLAAQGRGGAGGRAGGGAGAGAGAGGAGRAASVPAGPNQCHDITVYPAIGLAGGACGGYGLLLDISDVKNPVRIDQAADSNMSYWHSATFSNDGTKILFSDEWGGGGGPKCRATDRLEWGANALFTIVNRKMVFQSYYKMPAAQTEQENCVAHNGSLIPIPGREVMVQAFYQGGITVFDWTDPKRPYEVAYFDRGPMDATRMISAGSWSVYWYNGYMISSEIARGLDIFELTPSAHLTQNEIDAAKTVRFEQLNAQEQPRIVWPPSFALSRAFIDQLARSNGLAPARRTAVRAELASAEALSGPARRDALTALATRLDGEVNGSRDRAKMQMLVSSIRDLASAQR